MTRWRPDRGATQLGDLQSIRLSVGCGNPPRTNPSASSRRIAGATLAHVNLQSVRFRSVAPIRALNASSRSSSAGETQVSQLSDAGPADLSARITDVTATMPKDTSSTRTLPVGPCCGDGSRLFECHAAPSYRTCNDAGQPYGIRGRKCCCGAFLTEESAATEAAAATPNPAPLRLYLSATVAAENSCLASTTVIDD